MTTSAIVSNENVQKHGAVGCATYTVVAADVTAGYAVIDLTDVGTLVGALVQVRRSSGIQEATDVVVTLNNDGSATSNGKIKVADGASATNLEAGDLVYVTAWTA